MVKLVAGLALASILCVAPAAAITVNPVAANFSTPVGVTSYSFANSDGLAGNEIFRFGDAATTAGPNVFTFGAAATTNVGVNTQFTLGTLQIANEPTYNSNLTSVQLALNTTIIVNGTTVTPAPFLFSVAYDSTVNVAPCTYPSTTPCADAATISTLNGTGAFAVDGVAYTLVIDGFRNSSNAFSTLFVADENTTTTATVIGRFAAVTSLPEPASWATMVAGFGLLGAALRRRPYPAALA